MTIANDMLCKQCGSVLSAVTFTCVRGEYCKATRETEMANYDRLQLLESEVKELEFCKRHLPFRDWYAVKAINNAARFFDTKRKALNYARKHFSPDYEQVRMYHAG